MHWILRQHRPFAFTWYSQLSSDQLGYVATLDCFDELGGGYEVASARFVPETGTEVIHTLKNLVSELVPELPPKPDEVKPNLESWAYNFNKK